MVAHRISTVTLIILLWIYIKFIIRKNIRPNLENKLFNRNVLAGFNAYVANLDLASQEEIPCLNYYDTYNILQGRIWILIPIWITVAPYIAYRMSK